MLRHICLTFGHKGIICRASLDILLITTFIKISLKTDAPQHQDLTLYADLQYIITQGIGLSHPDCI